MRRDFCTFSGFGELLCIVLAWAVGIAAICVEPSDAKNPRGVNVAVSGQKTSSAAYYD